MFKKATLVVGGLKRIIRKNRVVFLMNALIDELSPYLLICHVIFGKCPFWEDIYIFVPKKVYCDSMMTRREVCLNEPIQ